MVAARRLGDGVKTVTFQLFPFLTACVLWLLPAAGLSFADDKTSPPRPRYETRADHDPNGIGKFYMGREIAHVMGHQAAGWLERPEREEEEQPSKLIELLRLKAGDLVADIGAGSGYHAF